MFRYDATFEVGGSCSFFEGGLVAARYGVFFVFSPFQCFIVVFGRCDLT